MGFARAIIEVKPALVGTGIKCQLRKTRKAPDGLGTASLAASTDVAAAYEAKEAVSFIALLPPDTAHLLIRIAMGDGYDELAAVEAIPTGTVKSRVHRAKERLADLLNDRSLLQSAG